MLACPEFMERCSTGGTNPAELGSQGPMVKHGWKLDFIQAENSATDLAQCNIKLWGAFSRNDLWISSLLVLLGKKNTWGIWISVVLLYFLKYWVWLDTILIKVFVYFVFKLRQDINERLKPRKHYILKWRLYNYLCISFDIFYSCQLNLNHPSLFQALLSCVLLQMETDIYSVMLVRPVVM